MTSTRKTLPTVNVAETRLQVSTSFDTLVLVCYPMTE
jgi:hypothetical protein